MATRRRAAASLLIALLGAASLCMAQAKPEPAGDIRALLPVGYLVRGTAAPIPAVRSAPVYWQDTVRTEAGGRVRIGLLDGSVLNVGSQSSLTVTRHDPAAQLTEIDLAYGRVRAKAARIAQPGGKFEVRTPVAVSGVVGTGFDVLSLADLTVVLCLEDMVRVRNADDHVVGEVILHAGEYTRVQRGLPPTPPSPASPEQQRESRDATSVAPPFNWSHAEVSWPPPECGKTFTLLVRAWAKQTEDGKEVEKPVDPDMVDGKLLLAEMAVSVAGGRATLVNAPGGNPPDGKFLPDFEASAVPAKIWPPIGTAAGDGWRAPHAAFVRDAFYVLGPVGAARQATFIFGAEPATVLWMAPCGLGLLAPMAPGATYPVLLSLDGKPTAQGEMNLVQVSYDVPRPPALMKGQTTRIGVELRGLAGLDRFTQGRPVEVTTLVNTTPEILGDLKSETPGGSVKGEVITYSVGAGNVDASGTARLAASGKGRQRGIFSLDVDNKLDEALERPSNPLAPVQPKP